MRHTDIAIVGGGLAGSLAAATLGRAGIACILVDPDPVYPPDYRVEKIGEKTFIVVVAAAYRTPDDVRPGIGMAYELCPGKTPYTKDSELQNAETSAWGRAIVATLAADTKRSVASKEEVRNRTADREWEANPTWDAADQQSKVDGYADEISKADTLDEIGEIGQRVGSAKRSLDLSPMSVDKISQIAAARKAELFKLAELPGSAP